MLWAQSRMTSPVTNRKTSSRKKNTLISLLCEQKKTVEAESEYSCLIYQVFYNFKTQKASLFLFLFVLVHGKAARKLVPDPIELTMNGFKPNVTWRCLMSSVPLFCPCCCNMAASFQHLHFERWSFGALLPMNLVSNFSPDLRSGIPLKVQALERGSPFWLKPNRSQNVIFQEIHHFPLPCTHSHYKPHRTRAQSTLPNAVWTITGNHKESTHRVTVRNEKAVTFRVWLDRHCCPWGSLCEHNQVPFHYPLSVEPGCVHFFLTIPGNESKALCPFHSLLSVDIFPIFLCQKTHFFQSAVRVTTRSISVWFLRCDSCTDCSAFWKALSLHDPQST